MSYKICLSANLDHSLPLYNVGSICGPMRSIVHRFQTNILLSVLLLALLLHLLFPVVGGGKLHLRHVAVMSVKKYQQLNT
jgi:hypothetical protein